MGRLPVNEDVETLYVHDNNHDHMNHDNTVQVVVVSVDTCTVVVVYGYT
jgi:hypothetical protein